ncbi:MAG: sporulation protein YunB [Clostridia bacterium]|nr:sporulation protein YunB [Clostridia bacterium]
MAYKRYPLRRLKYAFGGYKKKGNRGHIFHISYIYIALLLVFVSVFVFYSGEKLSIISANLACDQINNNMRKISSDIAGELMTTHSLTYSSIITANTDDKGSVQFLNTNFNNINEFKQDFEKKIAEYLNENTYIKCYVPLGAVFCSDLFSTIGPEIPIGILISSHAEVDFRDAFSSGGVNQTKHTILMNIKIFSKLHNAAVSSTVETSFDIPIAESIIVGEVPSVMLKEMQ